MRRQILAALATGPKSITELATGPKSITELAGGSMRYAVRAPIRAEVDRLTSTGQVRLTSISRQRLFALSDWRVTNEWLLQYLHDQMVREGAHLLWPGKFDRWERSVIRVDGQRVDVRRELYRLYRRRAPRNRESVRVRCEHDQCMAAACLVLIAAPGRRQSVATKQKLATVKRARSKYSPEIVQAVKASDLPHKQIARETGMALSTVGAIKAGRLWQDYRSPWAGLLT